MISSAQNTRIKQVRGLLAYSKHRRAEKAVVLEGVRLITDALESGAKIEYALYQSDFKAVDQLQALQVQCFEVESHLFNEVSETQTSQGILAVCRWPDLPVPENPNVILVLDGIADPGNVGTIFRTAAAVGTNLVILAPNSVDVFNPKVVRSAMGAHFRIPIRSWSWEQLHALNAMFVAADVHGDLSVYDYEWRFPLALIIGSEAHGISSHAQTLISDRVSIPMVSGESLNAAIATSVILYEVFRRFPTQFRFPPYAP